MNKKELHTVTGMTRDISVSLFKSDMVCDARNIRITSRGINSSLLQVTNERGNTAVVLEGDTSIEGYVLGQAVVNSTLILFTFVDSKNSRIYRIDFSEVPAYDEEGNKLLKGELRAKCTTLFRGNLNFNPEYPIETLVLQESETIVKVYWTDGYNQPRVIDTNKKYSSDKEDSFDFVKSVPYSGVFTVEKQSSGGHFPAGVIQYCYTYYNKYNSESAIVSVSPRYYISPKEKGLAADGNTSCSFKIQIKSPSTEYEYIRIYTILRTSENGTPVSRVLGDYSTNDNILVIDTGQYGSTVDSSSLLYKGGETITATTLTQKNNTLFLGNIHDNTELLVSALQRTNMALYGEIIRWNTKLPLKVLSVQFNRASNIVESTKFYDYKPNNDITLSDSKHFKRNENYRLGFIAQNDKGNWSDVIWIGDYTETLSPTYDKKPGFHAFIPDDLKSILLEHHYVNVKPVVVYPTGVDRLVLCQGILNSTVYNVNHRYNNVPYVQADWKFRSGYSWNRIDNEVQNAVNGNDYQIAKKNDGGIKYYRYLGLHNYGTINNAVNKGVALSNEEASIIMGEQFYRDPSIVTFHSPEVELTDDISTSEIQGYKARIVGVASRKESAITSFTETSNAGFAPYSRIQDYKNISSKLSDTDINALRVAYFVDAPIGWAKEGQLAPADDLGLEFYIYLWNRSGSLNNQETDNPSKEKSANLKHKVISELQYATTKYFNTQEELPVGNSYVYNYDQTVPEKLNTINNDNKNYYGNVESLLTSYSKNKTTEITSKYLEVIGLDMTKEAIDEYTHSPFRWSGYPINTVGEIRTNDKLVNGWKDIYDQDERWKGFNYPNNYYFSVWSTDPVLMKYKSTPHIVSVLKQGNMRYGLAEKGTFNKNFWFINTDNTHYIENPLSTKIGDNEYAIVEYYKDTFEGRFGGDTLEALTLNTWIPCGDTVNLIEGVVQYLNYKEGDTFYQRYDCLKTYPFTQEDPNSIVSILSTEIETRVNLDERYDKSRGLIDNTLVTPQNFNLVAKSTYNQTNNFFTYKALDYRRFNSNKFSNSVTWSLTKVLGEDIDTWTRFNLTTMLDLDGTKGSITKLVTFKDSIYAVQPDGISRIMYGDRVLIPTSDNNPIEITNGYNVSGFTYLSEFAGASNKRGVHTTGNGVYILDDKREELWLLSDNLTPLGSSLGFKTWLAEISNSSTWNPVNWSNITISSDTINKDVYFTSAKESLVFSESLGKFTSFMDYDEVPFMFNINNRFFCVKTTINKDTPLTTIWENNNGAYNKFFGHFKPFWMTFVLNGDYIYDKVFNNIEWRSYTYDNTNSTTGDIQSLDTFDTIRVWNDFQNTGYVDIENEVCKPSILKKKFNTFRTQIPRDEKTQYRDRIRNSWSYLLLGKKTENYKLTIFTDLIVSYFL